MLSFIFWLKINGMPASVKPVKSLMVSDPYNNKVPMCDGQAMTKVQVLWSVIPIPHHLSSFWISTNDSCWTSAGYSMWVQNCLFGLSSFCLSRSSSIMRPYVRVSFRIVECNLLKAYLGCIMYLLLARGHFHHL